MTWIFCQLFILTRNDQYKNFPTRLLSILQGKNYTSLSKQHKFSDNSHHDLGMLLATCAPKWQLPKVFPSTSLFGNKRDTLLLETIEAMARSVSVVG